MVQDQTQIVIQITVSFLIHNQIIDTQGHMKMFGKWFSIFYLIVLFTFISEAQAEYRNSYIYRGKFDHIDNQAAHINLFQDIDITMVKLQNTSFSYAGWVNTIKIGYNSQYDQELQFIGFNNSGIVQPVFTVVYTSETSYTVSYLKNLLPVWKDIINFFVVQFNPYRGGLNNNNIQIPCDPEQKLQDLQYEHQYTCYRIFQNDWLKNYVFDSSLLLKNIIYTENEIQDNNYHHRILGNISLKAIKPIIGTDIQNVVNMLQNSDKDTYSINKLLINQKYKNTVIKEQANLNLDLSQINQTINNPKNVGNYFIGVNASICQKNYKECPQLKEKPNLNQYSQYDIQHGNILDQQRLLQQEQTEETNYQKNDKKGASCNLRKDRQSRILSQQNQVSSKPLYNYSQSSYQKILFGKKIQLTFQGQGYLIQNSTGHYLHNIGSVILDFLDYNEEISLYNQDTDITFNWEYRKTAGNNMKFIIPLNISNEIAAKYHLQADFNISFELSLRNGASKNSGIYILQSQRQIQASVAIEGSFKIIADIFSTRQQIQQQGNFGKIAREIMIKIKNNFANGVISAVRKMKQIFCCVGYRKKGSSKYRGQNTDEYINVNPNANIISSKFSSVPSVLKKQYSLAHFTKT